MKTLTALRAEFKDYYFDRAAANRVVRFFETKLTHQLGELAGLPFKLERWQRYILRHFFGWKHKDTGLRKYKVLYLEVPRKNGKSILAAGLSLYLMDADGEPAARVVCFAANEDQARESVFDVAKEMVHSNAVLSSRITTFRNSMSVRKSASNFKLLSGSIKGKHGKNLSALIGDEVHEWESREAMDALRTSMVTRTQPVEIYLTTAGYDRNSICWEMHEYAEKIKEGIIRDPSFFGVIYAASVDDDWTKEETWRKANPNLGVSVRIEYLRSECKKAMEVPSYENVFKRLHLNIWTEQDSRWLPIALWDACATQYTAESLYGRRCFVGIDLSTTTDVAAALYLFPLDEGRYRVLAKFFLPEDAIESRKKRNRIPYDDWVRMGLIQTTEGSVLDYEKIRLQLLEDWKLYNFEEVSIDRWNATQLAVQLQGDGMKVEFWGQGYASMASPTKELEKLVLSRRLEHDGNEVLRWMAKNVAVEQDAAGNLKPSKRKSKEKIDGIVALLNALGRAILSTGPSVYEGRGIRTT